VIIAKDISPTKMNATEVTVRVLGGYPSQAILAPKLGPLGVSPKKVADDITKLTQIRTTKTINAQFDICMFMKLQP